jgi:hypothetical protein
MCTQCLINTMGSTVHPGLPRLIGLVTTSLDPGFSRSDFCEQMSRWCSDYIPGYHPGFVTFHPATLHAALLKMAVAMSEGHDPSRHMDTVMSTARALRIHLLECNRDDQQSTPGSCMPMYDRCKGTNVCVHKSTVNIHKACAAAARRIQSPGDRLPGEEETMYLRCGRAQLSGLVTTNSLGHHVDAPLETREYIRADLDTICTPCCTGTGGLWHS